MWVRVEGAGNDLCQNCSTFAPVAWKWFPRPTQWTLCYCEKCVELMLAREEAS